MTFSIALDEQDAERAMAALREEFAPELQTGEVADISSQTGLSIIAVVRESIKGVKGLGARLVNTLQRDGIEVKALSDGASETTIALVTDVGDADKALSLIHTACFS